MISQMAVQEFISDARRIRQSLRQGEVLLVDDELSINELLYNLCISIGEVARKVKTIEEAKWHIIVNSKRIKIAVLDYSINGEFADELVDLCTEYNIPCVIHTARIDLLSTIEKKYPGIIVIMKPAPIERILKELL